MLILFVRAAGELEPATLLWLVAARAVGSQSYITCHRYFHLEFAF